MVKTNIISENNLNIYNDFIVSVSESLNINPPVIKFLFFFYNKYDERPRIRGGFFGKDNVIAFALNYNFKNEEDVLKTGKHEIAEWLQFVITREITDRCTISHSYDPIFTKIRRYVTKYYPNYPKKLADYIKNKYEIVRSIRYLP